MDTAIPPREETGSQISARLLEVIAHAELEVLPGLYAFGPLTDGVTPRKDALACVRDGGAWSQLVPVDAGAAGQCVFFPRRHTPNLHDLDDAELTEIFALVKRVTLALELDQYNVLQNNGARAGQTVFHAHVDLVPKPTVATGLLVHAGLAAVDQTGLAERIRSRLAAPRS